MMMTGPAADPTVLTRADGNRIGSDRTVRRYGLGVLSRAAARRTLGRLSAAENRLRGAGPGPPAPPAHSSSGAGCGRRGHCMTR
eukprot:278962-Hanusia_phi.AAC.1